MKKLLREWLGIDWLEERVARLNNDSCSHFLDIKNLQIKTQGLVEGEAITPGSRMEKLFGHLDALIKNLPKGQRISFHYEDDPSYVAPSVPKVRVWSVVKK